MTGYILKRNNIHVLFLENGILDSNINVCKYNISQIQIIHDILAIAKDNILEIYTESVKRLEFNLNIIHFHVSKYYILVAGRNIINVYDLDGIFLYWTVAGDKITALLGLDCKHFISASEDGDLRFYNRDLIVGEVNFTQVVKFIIGIKGWKFLIGTNSFIAVYEKIKCLWNVKVSEISILKYHLGNVYVGLINSKFLVLNSKNGEIIKELNLGKVVLDIYFEEKIFLLLSDKQIIQMDFLLSNPLKLERKVDQDICEQEYSLNKSIDGLKHIQISTSLDQQFQCILVICSTLKVKKILLESHILKTPCFIVSNGLEFRIPLDLVWNKQGNITVTLGYEDNGSIRIYRTLVSIPRFNQCLYDSVKLPGLVASCIIDDFDVFYIL